MIDLFGLNTIGFLTLTFPHPVLDAREAQKMLHSFLANFIRPKFKEYICVLERHKKNHVGIHFHLLIPVGQDIRTGVDFERFKAEDYRSASPFLRDLWREFREVAPRYGFGRTELLPVRKTDEAIKFYVGKYISKHIGQRIEDDKGIRLMRISKGVKCGTSNFAWFNANARLFRAKLEAIAKAASLDYQGMIDRFGRHWIFHNQDIIVATFPDYRNFTEKEQNSDQFINSYPVERIVAFTQEMRSYFGFDAFPLFPDQAIRAMNMRRAEWENSRDPRYCYTDEERAIIRSNREFAA